MDQQLALDTLFEFNQCCWCVRMSWDLVFVFQKVNTATQRSAIYWHFSDLEPIEFELCFNKFRINASRFGRIDDTLVVGEDIYGFIIQVHFWILIHSPNYYKSKTTCEEHFCKNWVSWRNAIHTIVSSKIRKKQTFFMASPKIWLKRPNHHPLWIVGSRKNSSTKSNCWINVMLYASLI